MAVFDEHQNVIMGAAGQGGGYIIDQSILFNDDDSAYLTRTPGSASSHTTFTISMWIKRCRTGSMRLFSTALGVSNKEDEIYFESLDRLQWQSFNGGSSYGFRLLSQAVYRDFSAWMHIVAVLDSTNGTAADRQRLYVNGERITAFDAEVQASASYASSINNTQAHYFSRYYNSAVDLFDGYMAEINFIDGTALDATSFGKVNSTTGQWVPIEYTGSYGTNGFYITGEDSADLGADYSGNSNDFTSSGLTSADQVTDTPTDDAANNIGNYAVWNPLEPASLNGDPTFSNGNRTVTIGGAGADAAKSSIAIPTSGKWYFEATATIGAGNSYIGIADKNGRLGDGPASCRGYCSNGTKDTDTSASAYGATFATNDIIGVAVNMDSGTIEFYKNNTSQGIAFTDLITAGVTWFINCRLGTGGAFLLNTGQTAFAYTPPTGFKRLCTANLPEPTIADPSAYMQTTLYTGNGTAIGSGGNAISQSGNSTFQPDWVWIKGRSGATEHVLTDAVRGVTKELSTNDFNAEETVAEGLTTFGSAGFTVGSDGSYNTSSATYVGWQWKANGAGSSNEDGSVSSTVSVNTTAGFSIAKATAAGSGVTFSIGHGLGIAPSMVICKGVGESLWSVYHHKISSPNDNYMRLDSTTAVVSASGVWGTGPTSSVFSAKSGTAMSHSADFVAYCFADVEGFSKFGSYTGNGSTDGPIVNCGFLPAFVMVKAVSTANGWNIVDTERDTYNPVTAQLAANGADAEAYGVAMDFLSSGFKIRDTSAGFNTNTNSYIFMAFAESPFKYANAR